MPKIIPLSYYRRNNVVDLSQSLLGKILVTNFSDGKTAGRIVETEAYRAPDDKASHAYNNRRTKRTETMFSLGGVAYIYLCYGIHHLFNVVTGDKDLPHAILIRALEPLEGTDLMLKRRNKNKVTPQLTAGPGALSQAMGLTTAMDATPLNSQAICIMDDGFVLNPKEIVASPRVGVGYAKEDALNPWRFRIKDSLWSSKPN